jgi:hypothetical protein
MQLILRVAGNVNTSEQIHEIDYNFQHVVQHLMHTLRVQITVCEYSIMCDESMSYLRTLTAELFKLVLQILFFNTVYNVHCRQLGDLKIFQKCTISR